MRGRPRFLPVTGLSCPAGSAWNSIIQDETCLLPDPDANRPIHQQESAHWRFGGGATHNENVETLKRVSRWLDGPSFHAVPRTPPV